MFALATGMTIILLQCAQGGYVKFVEFVVNTCLGYYGINHHDDGVVVEKKSRVKRVVGWNEYMRRFLPCRNNRMVGDFVVEVDDEDDGSDEKIVLDNKTMLFHHRQHSTKKKKVARGRGKVEAE